MSQEQRADLVEIQRALSVMVGPGQVVELRALEVLDGGRRRTFAGYFDLMPLLAQEAAKLSGRAKGVYVTVNEIDPALFARRANRGAALGDKEPTTGDNGVVRRRWLLIDATPPARRASPAARTSTRRPSTVLGRSAKARERWAGRSRCSAIAATAPTSCTASICPPTTTA